MSYIRYNHEYQYVEGTSDDYIYTALDRKTGETYIVDYQHCGTETLVEFLHKILLEKQHLTDDLFLKYVLTKVAERLGVKLRDNPLSYHERIERFLNQSGRDISSDSNHESSSISFEQFCKLAGVPDEVVSKSQAIQNVRSATRKRVKRLVKGHEQSLKAVGKM